MWCCVVGCALARLHAVGERQYQDHNVVWWWAAGLADRPRLVGVACGDTFECSSPLVPETGEDGVEVLADAFEIIQQSLGIFVGEDCLGIPDRAGRRVEEAKGIDDVRAS